LGVGELHLADGSPEGASAALLLGARQLAALLHLADQVLEHPAEARHLLLTALLLLLLLHRTTREGPLEQWDALPAAAGC
jgi:hypothetical protein